MPKRPALPRQVSRLAPSIPDLSALARMEELRKVALARLRRERGPTMDIKRVGLCFRGWQMAVLEELARDAGFEHIATFLTRELVNLYPTLKRQPVAGRDGRQLDLLDTRKGSSRAGRKGMIKARS